MIIKGINIEDFINYKLPSMVIVFPSCTFKCEKESKQDFCCQNHDVIKQKSIDVSYEYIVELYTANTITKAIVFAGLEPFDSFEDMIKLIEAFRERTSDDIVIYTGYTESEIAERIHKLQSYKNIIVKFGRFKPSNPLETHYDEVLGVSLMGDNQYAKKIS